MQAHEATVSMAKAGARAKTARGLRNHRHREAAKGADVILLTVKPQTWRGVLHDIAPEIGAETLLYSVAASVPDRLFGGATRAAPVAVSILKWRVVRAMPNTPAAVGCGMKQFVQARMAGPDHLEIARSMFDAVGVPWWLMKAYGRGHRLSGSGPAFSLPILESSRRSRRKGRFAAHIATLSQPRR